MSEVWVCTWSVGGVARQRGSAPRTAPAPVPAVVQGVGRGRGRGHRVAAPGVVTGRVALPRVLNNILQSHGIFFPAALPLYLHQLEASSDGRGGVRGEPG